MPTLDNMISDVNDEQIFALCRASSSLEPLERLAEEQQAEFDALDFIGKSAWVEGRTLWGSEEFHSNVLAWLLDPKQTHGCGDCFLKPFLMNAGAGPVEGPGDWSGAEVKREWKNLVDGEEGYLDILIVNKAEQVLCAIENKVFSEEHSEQLSRYRKALEQSYPSFSRSYVFLTPARTLPFREEERAHWTSLGYAVVFDIVQQMVESKDGPTKEGIVAFLRQYAITLRRNIMPDTSISQMARKIYLEHQEAMDLIIANRPRWGPEAMPVLKEAIEEQPEWKMDFSDRNCVRFRSADWDQYESARMGSTWAPDSQALMLFAFVSDPRGPYIQLELSARNEVNGRLREKLFDAVWQHPKFFKPAHKSLTDDHTMLHYPDYFLNYSDLGGGWDDGTSFSKIKAWISNFAAGTFPAMNKVIVNCLQEYEVERQA